MASRPPSAVSPTSGIPASSQSLTWAFGSVIQSSRVPVHGGDDTTARTPTASARPLAAATPANR